MRAVFDARRKDGTSTTLGARQVRPFFGRPSGAWCYRVKDQLYVVDRLFDHAQLILGANKKAEEKWRSPVSEK